MLEHSVHKSINAALQIGRADLAAKSGTKYALIENTRRDAGAFIAGQIECNVIYNRCGRFECL